MAQYEVIVRSVVETSYIVEAKDLADAQARWSDGVEGSSIVDSENVVHVLKYDDRWDDDEPLQPEEYEADDYLESSV